MSTETQFPPDSTHTRTHTAITHCLTNAPATVGLLACKHVRMCEYITLSLRIFLSDAVSSHLPVTDIPNSFRTPVPRDSIVVHWVFLCSVFSPARGGGACEHGFSQPSKPPLCAFLCLHEVRNECFLNYGSWRKSILERKNNVTACSAFPEFTERLCFCLAQCVYSAVEDRVTVLKTLKLIFSTIAFHHEKAYAHWRRIIRCPGRKHFRRHWMGGKKDMVYRYELHQGLWFKSNEV